jgi:hypothetical protein
LGSGKLGAGIIAETTDAPSTTVEFNVAENVRIAK